MLLAVALRKIALRRNLTDTQSVLNHQTFIDYCDWKIKLAYKAKSTTRVGRNKRATLGRLATDSTFLDIFIKFHFQVVLHVSSEGLLCSAEKTENSEDGKTTGIIIGEVWGCKVFTAMVCSTDVAMCDRKEPCESATN